MTNEEFSNEFDVLYNSITSNQAPGLDEYEKSVFLTKAQDEIILQYFNPKGNKFQEGFDSSRKRQVDFKNLLRTIRFTQEYRLDKYTKDLEKFDNRSIVFPIPDDVLLFINESLTTSTGEIKIVMPISMDEYTIFMQKPYQYPPKKFVWRLLNSFSYSYSPSIEIKTDTNSELVCTIYNNSEGKILILDYQITGLEGGSIDKDYIGNNIIKIRGTGSVELLKNYLDQFKVLVSIQNTNLSVKVNTLILPIEGQIVELIGYNINTDLTYALRYIKRPDPIVIDTLPEGLSIRGIRTKSSCQLDPIIHQEILQRAVELAKAVYQGNLDTQIAIGSNSQTNLGIIPQSNNSK